MTMNKPDLKITTIADVPRINGDMAQWPINVSREGGVCNTITASIRFTGPASILMTNHFPHTAVLIEYEV
jgi:hypothetical protein